MKKYLFLIFIFLFSGCLNFEEECSQFTPDASNSIDFDTYKNYTNANGMSNELLK